MSRPAKPASHGASRSRRLGHRSSRASSSAGEERCLQCVHLAACLFIAWSYFASRPWFAIILHLVASVASLLMIRACIPERPEVLARIEAERRRLADRADVAAVVRATVSLSAVLDQEVSPACRRATSMGAGPRDCRRDGPR